MGLLANSTKYLREKNYANSLQSHPEDRTKGVLPNSFNETNITLIPNQIVKL